MKKYIIFPLAIIILLSGIGYYIFIIHTPNGLYAQAQNLEKRLEEKLIRLQVENPEEYKQKSNIYYTKILIAYKKIIKKFPDSEEAYLSHLHIAELYKKIEQYEESAKLYQEIIDKYHNEQPIDEALYKLGELQGEKLADKYKLKGIENLRRLVDEYPNSEWCDDAYFTIGKIYEAIGEYEFAIKWYDKVLEKYPDSELAAEIRLRLAQTYQNGLNDSESAELEYEKIEQLHPDTEEAKQASDSKRVINREATEKQQKEIEDDYYGGLKEQENLHELAREERALENKLLKQNIDILHYDLEIMINPVKRTLIVKSIINFQNGINLLDTLRLRFNQTFTIDYIKYNDKDIKFNQIGNELLLYLDSTLEPKAKRRLEIKYNAISHSEASWGYSTISENNSYLIMDSKWYPHNCYADMFTSDIALEVPKSYIGVAVGYSNGKQYNKDTITYNWRSDVAIPILTLAVAKYKEKTIHWKGMEITTYLYDEDAHWSNEYLQTTKSILEFYYSKFGSLPYKRLAIAEVSDFFGGYGSPTLLLLVDTSFKGESLPVSFLAHEIAHQWWGNKLSITGLDNSIVWLNEGFATYSDCLYLEHSQGHLAMQEHLADMGNTYVKATKYSPDEPIYTCNWESENYQPIVYYKGAWVLHTLRYIIGDKNFFKAFSNYAKTYSYQNVYLTDFQKSCEESSDETGKNLDWFFKEWIYQGGTLYPILENVQVNEKKGKDEEDKNYEITIEITQQTNIYHIPLQIGILLEDDTIIMETVKLENKKNTYTFSTKQIPKIIQLDPNNWLLKRSRGIELYWQNPDYVTE